MRGVRAPLEGRPRRALGQYFTPREVAAFAARLLHAHGAFDVTQARVIDPAAGPGLFLEAAEMVAPDACAVGCDIDPTLVGRRVHLGNGLVDDATRGIVEGAFDVVVGNPPYGGLGLVELSDLVRGDTSAAAWQVADAVAGSDLLAQSLGPPPPELAARTLTSRLGRWLDRAFRAPIEGLFMERFVRLLRAGGWMAVVVPEGVLANARAAPLRAWMAARGRVTEVMGLPRVFASAGAAARTALLVYQRGSSDGGTVRFADVDLEWVARGASRTRARMSDYLAAPPWIEVSWDRLREARWDPQYWDPRWAAPLADMAAVSTRPLGDFVTCLTYGPIVTRRHPRDVPGPIPIVSQGQIEESGINLHDAARVAEGSVFDPARCRVRRGDLLFPRSGAGSLGRNRLAVYDGPEPAGLGCFVDLIRLDGVNPWFVWVFLKTRFGWGQVRRLINGVGMPNISFDEIRSLRIPCVSASFQARVEQLWSTQVAPAHEALREACVRQAGVAAARAAAEAQMRALVSRVEDALMTGAEAL